MSSSLLFPPETVAIVTGSSSGIGAATVVQLVRRGVSRFCITGRNGEGLAETQKKTLEVNKGTEFVVVKGDLTDLKTCDKIVSETVDKFGRIDILVNNAGMGFLGSVRDAPIEQFQEVFDLNVKQVVYMCKLCLPYLEKTKGNIVNVSSTVALKSYANSANYNMSKAALDMFTMTLAAEEGERGIRVNGVNSGIVNTGMHARCLPPELVTHVLSMKSNAIGRVGEAKELARAIVFLASKEASFITGSNLRVDGGMYCYNPL